MSWATRSIDWSFSTPCRRAIRCAGTPWPRLTRLARERKSSSNNPLLSSDGLAFACLSHYVQLAPNGVLLFMNPWILLIGAVVFLWLWLSRSGGRPTQRGVLSFGKSRAREVENESVTFEDVAGVDEATEELKEVVDFLKKPARYAAVGARIPKGVLLVGPPGTGKTLLARAVAGEAGVPFYQLSGSDFVEMFVGVGAARVRDLFKKARESAPCIIFIDELDALGRARGAAGLSHEEREQTLNQLLVEMDGFDPAIGVIVMAATNRPEILDGALLRAGRFDRQVTVDRPDRDGRVAILKIHSRSVELGQGVDLDAIASRTPGFAGADLANLVNEAALLAARRNKKLVGPDEFEEAIERLMIGLKKKGRLFTEPERRMIAYHELGHACVAALLPGASPVQKVSIVPRGVTGGVTIMDTQDRQLYKRSELTDRIAVLLGGRAAELLFIGEPSTGAHGDLSQATEVASDMVRKYGMSDLGTRAFERPGMAMVNEAIAQTPVAHGAQAADRIDKEVQRILDEGMQRATELLTAHREQIEALAVRLLEEQTLSGDDVRRGLGLPVEKAPDGPSSEPTGDDDSHARDEDS
ncbi:MAG: ATP-dependent zinc metalloprotease FtsH [Deltaproteobacteria bacterium]|nr:ATP-dependent zinc metalloprotease FtsH [Deltaproteobacteria bacterium]